jgi:hypothetical protein
LAACGQQGRGRAGDERRRQSSGLAAAVAAATPCIRLAAPAPHLQLGLQHLLLPEPLLRARQLLLQRLQLLPLRLVLRHQLHVLGAAARARHRLLQRGLQVGDGAQQLGLARRQPGRVAPPQRRRQPLLLLAGRQRGGARQARRPRRQLAAQVLQDRAQPGGARLRLVALQPQLQQLHLGLQGAAVARACL